MNKMRMGRVWVAIMMSVLMVTAAAQDATVSLRPVHTLVGHEAAVHTIAYNDDGTQVVTGSADATVRVWDTTDGALLQTLAGHTDTVRTVAFSPDGRVIASASGDETMRLWSSETGLEFGTLALDKNALPYFAYSPDGSELTVVNDGVAVLVYDMTTFELKFALEGHKEPVIDVRYSPDGTTIITVAGDMIVRWSRETGEQLGTIDVSPAYTATYSPNASQLAIGLDPAQVLVWDLEQAQEVTRFDGPSNGLSTLAYYDDNILAVGGCGERNRQLCVSGEISFWDIEASAPLVTVDAHENIVYALAFHSEAAQMASASADNTAILWSLAGEGEQ